MVNRPAGGARSERHEREPHDWYLENQPPVRQMLDRFDFRGSLVWDPSCGRGNILDVAKERGHPTIGSDLFERWQVSRRHRFFHADFLTLEKPPSSGDRPLSIINNSPYSYLEDIAERFIRKALTFPIYRAAFLLPIAFLCGGNRWRFFEREIKPSHIAYLSERPSMPPGSKVDATTTFKGGMADYVWIIYTAGNGHRWRTESVWLRPDSI